jgi:hypothetical protein
VSAVPISSIQPVDRTGPLPLSSSQEQLWLAEQLVPGMYVVPVAVYLRGPFNPKALQQSIDEVVRRHEVLRTVFHSSEGIVRQLVTPFQSLTIPVTEISGFTQADRDSAIAERVLNHAKPFVLEQDILLRAEILRLFPTEHVLILSWHHIAVDGGSLPILGRELSLSYLAFSTGTTPGLPDVKIQYGDYAVWERGQPPLHDKQIEYWRRQLQGGKSLNLSSGACQRPELASQAGFVVSSLDPKIMLRLNVFSRVNKVSFFATLLAAFKVLLWDWSGTADVAVGTDASLRDQPILDGVIGHFINQVTVRSTIDASLPFKQFAVKVHEAACAALVNKNVPFNVVVKALGLRQRGLHPAFQVKFGFFPAESKWNFHGVDVQHIHAERSHAKIDLAVSVFHDPHRPTLETEYNKDLLNGDAVKSRMEQFMFLLGAAAAHQGSSLAELANIAYVDHRKALKERSSIVKPSLKGIQPRRIHL